MLNGNKKALKIGTAVIPAEMETLGFGLVGRQATGKTTVANAMLKTVRERGQAAIVVDAGAAAMEEMAMAGDVVLNPLVDRSVKWSPFAEMDNDSKWWDADAIARSIIPYQDGEASEWVHYAQALVSAVMRRLMETGLSTNGNLRQYLDFAKPADIESLVSGLPIQALFDKGHANILLNVRSIVGSSIRPYAYLDPATGADGFSIRKFVEEKASQADAPFLWIPYHDSQTAVLASMFASWMDIASQTLMDLETDRNRRLWLVADDLSSLGRINSIMQLLAKGRKKGASAIFGIQSMAQLREAYGREGAQVLMGLLQTWLVLPSDYETQSLLLGGYAGIDTKDQIQHGQGYLVLAGRGKPELVDVLHGGACR